MLPTSVTHSIRLCALTLLLCAIAPFAHAQEDTLLPKMPDPIQNLVNSGAQVRFLGKDYGVEGWVAIKNGKEQYFYVLPNSGGFISGILFDEKGKTVTVDQVRRLRTQGGKLLDSLAMDEKDSQITQPGKSDKYEFKTPAEQLYWDIENSNWIPVGQAGTPVFYSFISPTCPHCHDMMDQLRSSIDDGRVQIRMVPVGNSDESVAQAAYLLATPAPAKAWWRHMDGDENALPAKREINQQGVQKNLSIMQSWKLDVTPLIIYRGKDQKVKIIRGIPKDLDSFIRDLGVRS
ncbi:MAG: thioredoxin fold domain-containing protein [Alphaproteobacteria bacterium]